MALQTKKYTIGDLSWHSWSNAYLLHLTLTEQSVSEDGNYSVVGYLLQLEAGDNNRFSDYLICKLELAGVVVAEETVGIAAYYDYTYDLLSGTAMVPHNADGSLDMSVLANIYEPDGNNQYAPPEMTIEEIMTLTRINRGLVHIHDGSAFQDYAVYIHDGTEFGMYVPYIHDGTDWVPCT